MEGEDVVRTDEELKQIAKDIHMGKIFTDRQCPSPEMISSVFMVLAFMEKEHLKKMIDDKVEMFFEYMDQAGTMAVNGMPTFFSCQTAIHDEVEKIWAYYKAIKDAVDAVKL